MSIIAPLNVDKFISDFSLKEVKNPSILSSKGKYDPDGLFSESIFGIDRSKERRKTYAYINLNTKIIHPFVYQIFKKIEHKILDLADGETLYFDENTKKLQKEKEEGFKELSGFDGAMYAIQNGAFLRGETDVRDKLVSRLKEIIADGSVFIDKMLIIPPDFRPAQIGDDGSLIGVDEINSLYIKIINFSKKVKLVSNNDKEGIMSESTYIRREIQNLSLELFDYAKMKTGKKSGINRSNLLGKRVDFSGRTVITSGYDLPIGVAGVPYRMLANIAEPFLIHHFFKELMPDTDEYNVFMKILEKNDFHTTLNALVLTNFLRDLADGAIKLSKDEEDFIINVFQKILNDMVVILKRDPSLHKGSWQSYNIKVENQVAIRLNTAQTTLHNADFDGDTMAIYFPLTLEAQSDAKKFMHIPNGSVNTHQSSINIKHEYVLGSYTLTFNGKPKEPDLGVMKMEDVRAVKM